MQARAKAQGKRLCLKCRRGRGQAADPGPFQGRAAEGNSAQRAGPDARRQRVYGYDLMTQQERKEYQDRMRAAQTKSGA